MDFFYDGQVRRYLTQFMRIMSNFYVKDAKGQLTRVPVRYGDMNRQVGSILKKNSENTIPSAPFIACYIKDLQFDRSRIQDPTFVSTTNIRERAVDPTTGRYVNQQGKNYTVEKIMPTPYLADFAADIWTSNTDQKLQLWEQIAVLFNPSLELQTTDNYIDWTSISVLTLKSQTWSSRAVPQGLEQDIDILNMTFESHVWITPPVKVKQLGVITKIITNAFAVPAGTIAADFNNGDAVLGSMSSDVFTTVITPGEFDLLVLDNVAKLISNNSTGNVINISVPGIENSWLKLLDLYPGQFRAGLSQLRLTKPDGNEIVAYISMDPTDESRMVLNFDADTIPSNTIIAGRGTIDAIINPETFNPQNKITGTRYLILEDLNVNAEYGQPGYDGPDAWKNADDSDPQAYANDIIEWDGSAWTVVFNSASTTDVTYITNSYTGVQYKWAQHSWSKSFEGVYDKALWRLIL
jgi:hypothetical protein